MNSIIKYLMMTLCAITIIWSVKFIWQKEKWSPIDEYAHMDYIEKMGDGMMPKLQYAISHDIYMDLIDHPERSFTPPVHSREELGMGNYSYQAKHPPLYYSVLLLPNMMMKKMGYEAFDRLRILRLLSYFLFALGILMSVPIFNLLQQKGFYIPGFYAWTCVFFGLLIATHQRYGLTNNMLSPLFINTALFLILKYHLTYRIKFLYLFMLVTGLSVSVSLTNVFIVPFLLLYALIIYIPHFSLKTFIYAFSILLASGLVIVWWQLTTIPDKAFEEFVQNLLLYIIPANLLSFEKFIDLLLEDSFKLSFINDHLDISMIYLVLLVINIVVSLIFLRTILKEHRWILISMLIFAIFVLNLYFLNRYVPRVHWMALRNYLGFIPIIFISSSAFIVVISKKITNTRFFA
ncbi:MAG: hypothetical protein HY062_08125 [Bacteroidetes bacterium]|nr:hypothetical protein [Bacteroidota bacterium]